ncbi:hypothetical protein CPB83DRAFT_855098 [Crepidotus variabilis]|uniref:Arrestin-like N-terminal domain-containing protein n=1 Tax=Crepidotus variabilis TaxID=179855 RepID=A0A9P6EFI6_9AGAR|nr:hypothetical protein CPB83DRAFT_855098 [Crepidotus variabilis]
MASSSSSTPPNDSAGRRRRSVFAQRFSALSIASLPQYTVVDNSPVDEPPTFEASSSPLFFDANDLIDQSPPSSALQESSTFLLPNLFSPARNRTRYSYINPLYSTILNATARTPFTQTPDFNAPRPRRHDFEYLYPNRPNKPSCTLQLNTRDSILGNPHPSQSQPKTPRIWGSEPLAGFVHLDLETAQNIQQINLQIKGKIITSALEDGAYTFVGHEYQVWTKTMGDPRDLSPSVPINSPKGKFDGKFQGKYSLPFSFPFPIYVDLANKAAIYPEAPILSPSHLTEEPGELPSITSSPVNSTSEKGKKKRTSWSFFSSRNSSHDSSVPGEHPKKRRSALPQDMISGSGPSSRENTERASSYDPQAAVACPMPQTFVDKGFKVSLNYEISAILVHGRFRPDTKIRTNIAYLPSIEPLPMSVRRQQAYEAGALLPSPRSDPDGWFAVPTATVHGWFDEVYYPRQIQVDCTLYLANPLSYTRSTAIPCYLSLSCTDTQALQSLCNPKSPNVRLMRQFRHFTPHGGDRAAALEEHFSRGYSEGVIPSQILPPQGSAGATGAGGDLKVVLQEVSHAVWWAAPKEVLQDPTLRWMEGEIHLEPSLQPSCACSIFSVEYSVEMYPPKSAYFESAIHPSSSGNARAGHALAISSQPVEITTLYRIEEPVPVAFSEAPRMKVRVLSADAITEQLEE